MSIYDTLNREQREAVMQTEGPVLILAGAGSAKTLEHPGDYLYQQGGRGNAGESGWTCKLWC